MQHVYLLRHGVRPTLSLSPRRHVAPFLACLLATTSSADSADCRPPSPPPRSHWLQARRGYERRFRLEGIRIAWKTGRSGGRRRPSRVNRFGSGRKRKGRPKEGLGIQIRALQRESSPETDSRRRIVSNRGHRSDRPSDQQQMSSSDNCNLLTRSTTFLPHPTGSGPQCRTTATTRSRLARSRIDQRE